MAWKGMVWQGKNMSLNGKEICDIKLSHMALEKMFFISWDKKCSFFVMLVSFQSTFLFEFLLV
jgi:hypothetical protein